MASSDPPDSGWTVVLRRQPARLVQGQPEGGYADVYEIICCDCGDDPDLDYREVSLRLQLVRGPYPIAAGVGAYEHHLKLHDQARRAMGTKAAIALLMGAYLAVSGSGVRLCSHFGDNSFPIRTKHSTSPESHQIKHSP